MAELAFGQAIDRAIEDAMARDDSIVLLGEDAPLLRAPLYTRFGAGRVRATPISEAAFVGAAGGAAMAGLRPIVELYMVDFVAVALDAILNHIAKLARFSGGAWSCPLVIRAPCGGGYGDGGQHGQALWGLLAAIPGLTVVVPSTAHDAYGLVTTALAHDGPVVVLEPKLLSETWLELLGRGGRTTVTFDIPDAGTLDDDELPAPVPFGSAAIRRAGADVTVCSVGIGVHRALEAATRLATDGLACEVIDLRCLRPLDVATIVGSVTRTGRLVVVDEDYRECGLSGELAAIALEAGLAPRYARVCVEDTLPYARSLEAAALPNVARICDAVRSITRS
ncbi:MAG TPA: transketolase C-terminal domain-containing protein [Kofleriaceae bacterium]|nr:transketolase C-terminal domain-containing protein [Kofleriaceae bacterium]